LRARLTMHHARNRIAAEKRLSFAGDSVLDGGGEAVDRADGARAERNANDEDIKAAQTAAQIPQCQFQRKEACAARSAARGGQANIAACRHAIAVSGIRSMLCTIRPLCMATRLSQ